MTGSGWPGLWITLEDTALRWSIDAGQVDVVGGEGAIHGLQPRLVLLVKAFLFELPRDLVQGVGDGGAAAGEEAGAGQHGAKGEFLHGVGDVGF